MHNLAEGDGRVAEECCNWRRGGDSNPRTRLAGLTVFEQGSTVADPYPLASARLRFTCKWAIYGPLSVLAYPGASDPVGTR